MAKISRLAGLPDVDVNPETREINFALKREGGRPIRFVADVAVVEQLAAALAQMARALRQATPQTVIADDVAEHAVQRDPLGGLVFLRLVTSRDIAYTFALPLVAAKDIAARLQNESAKDQQPGTE